MYDFFTTPDYLKDAEELKKLNSEIEAQNNKLKNDKDPNAPKEPIEPVSGIKQHTPLELGGLENTFQVSSLNKQSAPASANIPATATKSMDQKLDFLGSKGTDIAGAVSGGDVAGAVSGGAGIPGVDIAGSIMEFGTDVFTTAKTDTPNVASGIMNTAKMTTSGAKAGMAVGGPIGAAVGGSAGFIYGGIDAATDIKKANRKRILDQRDKDKELVIAREQGQRTEDGLDSLTKLTAIRKQQSSILG